MSLARIYLDAIEHITPSDASPGECLDGLTALLAAYIFSSCPEETRGQAVEVACVQLTELVSEMGAAGL